MKRVTYLFVIALLSANSFAQGHFVLAFTGNGQNHMNINVVTATIGGVALEAGDEIAAFDGTICCGKVTLAQPIIITNSSTFAAIAASQKDEGLSNGYTSGNAITYKIWDSSKSLEFSGTTNEYLDPGTGLPSTAPTYTINGTAFVKLSVVAPANQAPLANAGADLAAIEGTLVTLDGSSSSDPDNNPLSFSWTAPEGIVLSSNTVAKPTFTAPEVNTDTDYTFSLTVNDGTVNSTNADQVTIKVKKINNIPLANAGNNTSVNEGTTVTLDGTASYDLDNDALTYEWTAPAGVILSSSTTSKPTFIAPVVTENTDFTCSLVVNDGITNSTPNQVIITVLNLDHIPYVKDPIKDVSVDKASADQIIDLKTVFTDDDAGDVLNYSVSLNTNEKVVQALIVGTDLILRFSTANSGFSEIEITASSNGKEAKSNFAVEVKIPTGINPLINEPEIQIYPNPTNGRIQLKFNQTPEAGTWVTIYNITGRIISKSLAENKLEYLNLNGYPAGLYFIKIDKKIPRTFKIVLK